MHSVEIVRDSLGRVHELVPAVLEGMDADDLTWRPDAGSNPIGWLVWHLCRAEDGSLASIGDTEQVWLSGGWQEKFGLPYERKAGGFGQSSEQVGQFSVSGPELLVGYAAAVAEQTGRILDALTDEDLDRVIDTRWDPPVTVGVRIVSIMVETAQHIGQASYLKGLQERTKGTDSGWHGYV
jgi:hypothetical protein